MQFGHNTELSEHKEKCPSVLESPVGTAVGGIHK